MMYVKEKLAKFFEKLSGKITYRHWLAIAAATSIILGLVVFAGLSGSGGEEKSTPVDTVHVVVAKQDIAPKTILKESMLEQREVPSYMVPEDAVKEISDIVNKPAKVEIMKDDIITTRKVLMDITMAGFTGEIPPECRAISIAISDVTGVAGFAKPGDYVDVMVIAKGDDKMTGRIVLQDIQLLAINQVSENPQAKATATSGDLTRTGDKDKDSKENGKEEAKGDDAPISNLATATLAVLPADALKLITEAQEGTLYLALRPYKPRDKFTTDTRYTHYSTTKSNSKTTTAPAPAAQSAPPASYSAPAPVAAPSYSGGGSVEVIRGTTTTREGA